MDSKREKLSPSTITRHEAAAKPYRVWDTKTPGLFLRVQPSGVRTFNVQWSRVKSKSLGRYPALTIDGARKRALAILNDAASAEDGIPRAARATPRAEVSTLEQFVVQEYRPWARQHLKRADEAAARLLRVFAKLAGDKLATIDHKAVEDILTARRRGGASKATANRDLGTMKAALAKAVDWKLLPANPLAGIKAAKVDSAGIVRYLRPDEEERLRSALEARDGATRAARARTLAGGRKQHAGLVGLPVRSYGDHLSPLVLTALNTGCRRGELLSLRWTDIDLPGRLLTVPAGYAKSGKTRHVPLNREAVEVLTRWRLQGDGEGRVFRLDNPKKAWGAVLESAEIEQFRFHDLRHTFASKLVMAGVDLNTVRELLGHADIKMTLRYAHLAPEHKAAAVERLVA